MPLLLLTISILFCILTGCSSQQETPPTFRIGHAPHDHHAALFIAAQLPEYFQQNGGIYLKKMVNKQEYQLVDQGQPIANLVFKPNVGGGQLIRKLNENQVDLAMGSVPAMIQQIDAGSGLKIVAPLMSEGAALVMGTTFPADDWPGFIEQVRQAKKPLRIGYKIQTSVQNLIFEQALRAEGIHFSQEQASAAAQLVVFNMFGATNLIPALKNGLIDGFVVMQPFVAQAEYQQVGKAIAWLRDLPPDGQWKDHPCCALAANGPLLDTHREVLTSLVTLLLRANRYLQKQPQQSASLVANWLERPVAVEELSLPTINFLVDYPDNWQPGINQWIDIMDKQGRLNGRLASARITASNEALLYDMAIYNRARGQVE